MDKLTKLSQAIRLGATFRPQCQFALFNERGESCALGAAHEAVTGRSYWSSQHDLHPLIMAVERFGIRPSIAMEVVYRNNGERGFEPQTREQIADWLEAQGL